MARSITHLAIYYNNINKKVDYLHSMKRAIFFAAILLLAMATKAQVHPRQAVDTNKLQQKWFVTKSAGITAGFAAFKGGSAQYVSAPLELLVNRQLSNNLIAFGGVSATPYLVQYNGGMYQPAVNKQYGFMRTNNTGIYPAAKVGLMYISNDRTFSISGSVSVSRSSYFNYAPVYSPVHMYNPAAL